MQRGCLKRNTRKRGPDVWQFRWSEISIDGKRLYHKKIIGTIEQFPDEDAARRTVAGLITELNAAGRLLNSATMTVGQLCDHFEQRELVRENTWRSHATKKIYKAYLARWIRPQWQKCLLGDVRTIQVESWLRTLPLAKSSCAKIRNLMSVLFNHACRYELFDRNPIYLVRQSAKRRAAPTLLLPAEIKALINVLELRERTLVLLAASTGLRQSELFGLKWGDIDFAQGIMERHALRCVRRGRSLQNGIITKARASSSRSREGSDGVESAVYLSRAQRLGFCEQALPRSPALLGAGDPAKIRSACGAEGRDSEAIRLAYFPAHVLDSAEKCWDGIQSDAGAVAAFFVAFNSGRLHTGTDSR